MGCSNFPAEISSISGGAYIGLFGSQAVLAAAGLGTTSSTGLAALTTILSNGELDLRNGTLASLTNLETDAGLLNFENNETVTIGGPLNLAPSGRIKVDAYDNAGGGSQITIAGDLTNGTYNSFGDSGVSVGKRQH